MAYYNLSFLWGRGVWKECLQMLRDTRPLPTHRRRQMEALRESEVSTDLGAPCLRSQKAAEAASCCLEALQAHRSMAIIQ